MTQDTFITIIELLTALIGLTTVLVPLIYVRSKKNKVTSNSDSPNEQRQIGNPNRLQSTPRTNRLFLPIRVTISFAWHGSTAKLRIRAEGKRDLLPSDNGYIAKTVNVLIWNSAISAITPRSSPAIFKSKSTGCIIPACHSDAMPSVWGRNVW